MLTLSSAFTNAFSAASVEPVILAEIFTSTADASATVYCTGGRLINFSGIYNHLADTTTGPKTAEPSLAFVSPLSLQIDPFERTVARTNITLTFHDDGAIRELAAGTLLFNKSVNIRLGAHSISGSADWAPVFRGLIKKVTAREGQIDLYCTDAFEYLDRPYNGAWYNRHPLEAIKKIIEDCGAPAGLIDDTSFDVTNAEYAGIAHYVTSLNSQFIPGFGYGFGVLGGGVREGGVQDRATYTAAHGLARAMNGGLYVREDGKAAFKLFNKATAAVAHWGVHDISDFSHSETILVNEIEAGITSTWLLAEGERNDAITVLDAASQTAHSYPGTSNGVYKRGVSFEINDMYGRAKIFIGDGDTSILISKGWSFAGTRVVGDFTNGDSWADMQTAGTTLSDTRPLYVKVENEIIKCRSLAFRDSGGVMHPREQDADGNAGTILDPSTKDVPEDIILPIEAADRGQFGTTAVDHVKIEDETHKDIMDLTMAVEFATAQLDRFSNGAPLVEVTTNLSQWAVQVGDLVTIDSDVYLAHGFNGLADNTKFEVVRKELRLDDSNSSILWGLAYATHTAAVVPTKTYKYFDPPRPGKKTGSTSGETKRAFIKAGLEVTEKTGLIISIGEGLGFYDGQDGVYYTGGEFTLPPSLDCYVMFYVPPGIPHIRYKTIGAEAPETMEGGVFLAKVVTGAAGIVSVTDERDTTPLDLSALPTADLKPGGNLIYNPSFENWAGGAESPPDQWAVNTGTTWVTDATRDSAQKLEGGFSLEIGGDDKQINSEIFPVDANRVYEFSAAAIASSTDLKMQAGIEWLDVNKDPISMDYAINQTGLATWTTRAAGVSAPAGAKYGRVKLFKGTVNTSSGAPVGEVLLHFDDNLTDTSGSALTVSGANIAYTTGKFNNAAVFNGSQVAGSNTHVEITGIDDIGTGPYSIEFWVYIDAFPAGGTQALINNGSGQAEARTGDLNIALNDDQLVVAHQASGSPNLFASDHGISAAEWYHVAVCRDDLGVTRLFVGQPPAPAAAVMFHFDDDYDDSSGNDADATNVGTTFQDSTVTGTGFDRQIDFPNAGGVTGSTAVTFPDPEIGEGAFTFECWFNSDLATAGQMLFSEGGNTYNGTAYGDVFFDLTISGNTNAMRGFELFGSHATGQGNYTYWGETSTGHLWSAGEGMKHVALVRAATSGGNSQWSLYFDGNYIAPNTVENSLVGNLPTVDMGGQDHHLGRAPYGAYYFNGQMDEVRISLVDTIYTGTNTYTIPTAPFTAGGGGANLIGTHSGTGYQVGGEGLDWTLGRLRTDSAAPAYNLDGMIDELLITKTAKYVEAFTVAEAAFDNVASESGDAAVIFHFSDNYDDSSGNDADATNVGTTFQDSRVDLPDTMVLFHFDDDYDDSSGNDADATNVGTTFQDSTVTGTGFNRQIDFPNAGGVTGSTAVTFPDPGVGVGPFTFECWFNSDLATAGQMLFSEGGNTYNGTAYGDVFFDLTISGHTNSKRGFELFGSHATGQGNYTYWGETSTGHLWSAGEGMKHVALVRAAASGGNSQWSLYFDGNYIAPNTLANSLVGNLPTVDMGGQAHHLGRAPYGAYYFNGQMDEVRISLVSDIYTGTSTYTIPTAPFELPAGGATVTQGYFDQLRLTHSVASFRAKQETAQATVAATDSVKVVFNIEVHDIGENYSTANNNFTVQFDGVYQFNAQVFATVGSDPTTQGPTLSVLKNRAGTPETIVSGGYSYESSSALRLYVFAVDSGTVELSAGDTIDIQLNNVTNEVMTIRDNGDETWFTGRQVS